MSAVLSQLKARQAAQAAATLAAAASIAGTVPQPPPDLGLPEASTTEPTIPGDPTEAEKAAVLASLAPPVEPPKKGPAGSYRSCNLQRFHKANGECVTPDADGFFIPKDAEEATILAHHATHGWDLVEFQEGEEGSPV